MNQTHLVRDMNHHRKENILTLSFHAISLMALAMAIANLLAYVIYKRHFNPLGSIIKVILSSIVFIFLSGIALFPLTILIISSLP